MSSLLFLQEMDFEFLGPAAISAMIKKHGHACRVAIGRKPDDFRPVLQEFHPDLVAFSVMTGSHLWALETAGTIKKEYGIPAIFGGPHPTFFPDFCKEKEVDYLVRGEGEETLLEIMDRLDKNESLEGIPNLWLKKNGEIIKGDIRPLQADPDIYPFPDRKLYKEALGKRLDTKTRTVLSSRGCPYHCTFCFEDSLRELYQGKGKFVRLRKIDKVIEECLILKKETDVRVIYFMDDVFGIDKEWLYAFLPVYKKEIGLPFICLVRADRVASEKEYAFRLAQGGCVCVFFGIETGNEILRNRILKKELKDEQIIQASQWLHEAGIMFRAYNIMGLPDETLQDAFSTVDLNIRIKTDYPWCSIYSPLPGTELADYAIHKGYLDKSFDYNQLSKSFFVSSKLNIPQIREMSNLQKFFQTAVLWPWTYPLIKKLIQWKPNPFFTLWFGFIYFLTFIRSERRSGWDTFCFAIKNYRRILK
jgi:anaerobic magnesium-protoporphyrin IX monomethyl ester cyclase